MRYGVDVGIRPLTLGAMRAPGTSPRPCEGGAAQSHREQLRSFPRQRGIKQSVGRRFIRQACTMLAKSANVGTEQLSMDEIRTECTHGINNSETEGNTWSVARLGRVQICRGWC